MELLQAINNTKYILYNTKENMGHDSFKKSAVQVIFWGPDSEPKNS